MYCGVCDNIVVMSLLYHSLRLALCRKSFLFRVIRSFGKVPLPCFSTFDHGAGLREVQGMLHKAQALVWL